MRLHCIPSHIVWKVTGILSAPDPHVHSTVKTVAAYIALEIHQSHLSRLTTYLDRLTLCMLFTHKSNLHSAVLKKRINS